MAADSGGKSEWELKWEAEQRKDFQTDPAMWLNSRHVQVGKWIDQQGEQQIRDVKGFLEHTADLFQRGLVATRESVILYVTLIAIIGLAAAGIWFGVAGVALVIGSRRWLMWSAEKQDFRLERFRHRFRELLKQTDSGYAEMLAEDKKFLRKYEDSILYPLVVPEHKRERPSSGDLDHIETLYREYCYSLDHEHVGGPGLPGPEELRKKHLASCGLCAAAQRVRQHIEGTISNFETETARWRQALVTRIDGNNPEGAIPAKGLLEDVPRYRALGAGPELRALLEWLRDKERWTFDHAEKVLDACRADESVKNALSMRKTIPGYVPDDPVWKVCDKLSRAMQEAATKNGLDVEWKHYRELKEGFVGEYGDLGETFTSARRVMARRSPEVMFRELTEKGYQCLWYINRGLERLKNYGYDSDLVEREVLAAQKFLAKEGWKWDKCYRKELDAAKSFVWLEDAVKELRYRELPSGTRPEPIASRIGKTVGKLIGRRS